MKKIFLLLFFVVSSNFLNAQIHEIGVFLGGSNYIGDIGKTDYISPEKGAVGILYKWNKSPRHSYRISYTQTNLIGEDKQATDPSRVMRNYQFENSIKELSAGLEFNFLDFNLHNFDTKITPYFFSGLNYLNYESLFFQNNIAKKDKNRDTFSIPMVLGIKTNILNNFILGIEAGARYSFTDNLDGSNPDNNKYSNLKFGNVNSNDWYVFSGLTLTYTFGNKPCYCAE